MADPIGAARAEAPAPGPAHDAAGAAADVVGDAPGAAADAAVDEIARGGSEMRLLHIPQRRPGRSG